MTSFLKSIVLKSDVGPFSHIPEDVLNKHIRSSPRRHSTVNSNRPLPTENEKPDNKGHGWSFKELFESRKKAKRRIMPAITVSDEGNAYLDVPKSETLHAFNSQRNYVVQPPLSDSSQVKRSQKKLFIIRLSRPFRIKWDLFVMCLAGWNCWYNPYSVAYEPEWAQETSSLVVNTIIDMIFFLDVFLNFRTTFFSSSTGDEIFDSRLIAKNYLVGRFWIDLMSCIPSDLLSKALGYDQDKGLNTGSIISMFALMKLGRISRLNRIITYLRAKNDFKMLIRIGQLIFFLLMYIHLVSCAWWIIVNYDQEWVPISDRSLIFEKEVSYQYWISFYTAVQLLVGGEVGTRNSLQACFGAFMIMFGALLTAIIFGDMAVLMSNMNIRQTKFQESQNAVNTAMKNLRLPDTLQQHVSDYLIFTEATLASREDLETFKNLISPSLYRDVLYELYENIIKKNSVIGNSDIIYEVIVSKLTPLICKPEEQLILQGSMSDDMSLYFVARGDCAVFVQDEKSRTKLVNILRPGQHFGEVALITNGGRTATVRARNYCTLAMLHREDFTNLISTYSHTMQKFKEGMFAYDDRYKKYLLRMIKRIPFFKELMPTTLQELLYSMKPTNIEQGEFLIKPGVANDCIIFILDGMLEVSFTLNDRKIFQRKETALKNRVKSSDRLLPEELSSLKPQTEIYPLWSQTGITGSIHITELDKYIDYKLLGKYCIESVLDYLESGSSIGFFTLLSNDTFFIQVKAKTKCSLACIDKEVLNRLRINHVDLHKQLSKFESWGNQFTPYVDDYIVSSDSKPGLQFDRNMKKGLLRLRGAVLRVIKENRDKWILKTPMISLMLNNLNKQTKPNSQLQTLRYARRNSQFNENLYKATKKLQTKDKKKQLSMSTVNDSIELVNKHLHDHSRALENLVSKLDDICSILIPHRKHSRSKTDNVQLGSSDILHLDIVKEEASEIESEIQEKSRENSEYGNTSALEETKQNERAKIIAKSVKPAKTQPQPRSKDVGFMDSINLSISKSTFPSKSDSILPISPHNPLPRQFSSISSPSLSLSEDPNMPQNTSTDSEATVSSSELSLEAYRTTLFISPRKKVFT